MVLSSKSNQTVKKGVSRGGVLESKNGRHIGYQRLVVRLAYSACVMDRIFAKSLESHTVQRFDEHITDMDDLDGYCDISSNHPFYRPLCLFA
jgi:hypothetical protein